MTMIHDNFDGSNWCVDCDGPCKLIGADKVLTNLVRRIFECHAHSGSRLCPCTEMALKDAGVDIARFKKRAEETNRSSNEPLIVCLRKQLANTP